MFCLKISAKNKNSSTKIYTRSSDRSTETEVIKSIVYGNTATKLRKKIPMSKGKNHTYI